eukprot:GHVN01104167.1.p1 GENE.GHVN01104167.1~~GHVN01104167.1.p1  ORF type:complete len:292 (+),score=48.30 GHVN01104167.1:822-1697(+)
MTEAGKYVPEKVWKMKEVGGSFGGTNRPDSGAREEKTLPVGDHPFQVYSMGTPNGQKVTIMFEELLAAGIKEAEYDSHMISIGAGDQFGSDFVAINPNSKIPAVVDKSSSTHINLFESGSILFYLAEKFNKFIPSKENHLQRANVMNWLFWLQGSAPYLGGGFGHFFAYAPEKMEYPIYRFAMETKRQLDVLDKQLCKHKYIGGGDDYTIADIAIWPWYGGLVLGRLYKDSAEYLDVESYKNVIRWAKEIDERPAVKRGRIVNRVWGDDTATLKERHSAKDIDEAFKNKGA